MVNNGIFPILSFSMCSHYKEKNDKSLFKLTEWKYKGLFNLDES